MHSESTRKLHVFDLGNRLVGVFSDEIATVVEWRKPTPLPFAPPAILGVVSIQGRMLTVLDPTLIFTESEKLDSNLNRFLVALRGDEQIALAIKDKGTTMEVGGKEFLPPTDDQIVLSTLTHKGQTVSVLDLKALFPAAIKGHERRRRQFVDG